MRNSLYIAIIFIGAVDLGMSVWILSHSSALPYSSQIFVGSKIFLTFLIFMMIKSQTEKNKNHLIVLGFFVFIFNFFYSLFGVIAILFILRSYYWETSKSATLYHIDQEEGEISGDTEITKKISIRELTRVAPLIDGLTDDDKNNRIATVLAMEQLIDYPSIRNALMRAANDPQKEVQYYINDALKKVSEEYMDKIKKQLDIINKSEPTYESYKKLADFYGHLAIANIDHIDLIKFYYIEMEKYYMHLIENYPENKIEILHQLIPALYSSKAYDKCISLCEEVEGISELSSISVLYKLRSLFGLKKLDAVRELIASVDLGNLVSEDNLLNEAQIN